MSTSNKIRNTMITIPYCITWMVCGSIIMLYLTFSAAFLKYWISDSFSWYLRDILDWHGYSELSIFDKVVYPIVVLVSIPIWFVFGPIFYSFIISTSETKKYLNTVLYDLKNSKETLWYE